MQISEHLEPDAPLFVDALPDEAQHALAGYQNKLARVLLEISRTEGPEQFAATRQLPTVLLKQLHKAMALFDESTQYYLGVLRRSGHTVRCETHCPHCCTHMPVGLSALELLYLYQGMWESGAMPRLYRRCLESEEQWVEILHRGTVDEVPPLHEALTGYHAQGNPCPFLQDARCRLYPFRPIACRMHFSLSPPAWCHPGHFQHDYAVQVALEPSESVLEALGRVDSRFQFTLSDVMVCGLLELTVNVMQFQPLRWT